MQAMRVSSAFCIAGWLVIYFSQGPVPLDIGRLATGYGMGVFSFVVGFSSSYSMKKILKSSIGDFCLCANY
jgi:hypothetical protein